MSHLDEALAKVGIASSNGTGTVGDPTVEPPELRGVDVRTFLDQPEPEYDWLIPGLLERRDRVLLTGPEGGGKSTLARQLAVQCAAGIHPFTLDEMEPIRVALVDAENSASQIRRALRPLTVSAGDALDPERLTIIHRPEGLDLLRSEESDWLRAEIDVHEPDLLVIGPLYKMAGGDPNDETTARPVANVLDRIRKEHGCALWIEAHSPHATGGKARVIRPYGASLWIRWPEFGPHLAENGVLKHWRNPRDERTWPDALQRGGEWPWTPAERRVATWALIVDTVKTEGYVPSYRDLAKTIGVGKGTIERAITNNKTEWTQLIADVERGVE